MDISDVENLLHCNLSQYCEDEDYETLGGMLLGLLDRIPNKGEKPSIVLDEVTFTVAEANERQILKVTARKLAPIS